MSPPAAVPAGVDLAALAAAARDCQACELAGPHTRTVFGEGPPQARLALVGEQPGDVEDRRGRPFVGPAGLLLNRALRDAGLERDEVYLTNAVKHFRFTWSAGRTRRVHVTPEASHILACRPWLAAELNRVRPEVVVVRGAPAAAALLGPGVRVTRDRGRVMPGPPGSGAALVVTVHPAAVLRTGQPARETAYAALVADLALAGGLLTTAAAGGAGEPGQG